MFGSVIPLLLAAPLVSAVKLVKAPLSSRILTTETDGLNLIGRSDPSATTNNRIVKIVTTVQTGNNQQFSEVLLDTGSAITWVGGSDQKYRPGVNTQILNQTFSVGYGAGGASGIAYRDHVTVGEATANNQIIGAANVTSGFKNIAPIDGILGLGPSGSNAGEVSGFNTTPTFVETLVSDGVIDNPVFGLYIKHVNPDGLLQDAGEITFGGVDQSVIAGGVTWVPQNEPWNFRWSLNVSGFNFGDIALTEVAPAYTDCGVLPIEIPFDQFFDIRDAYNGTIDADGFTAGFLSFPPTTSVESLPPLNFTIGEAAFSLSSEAYLIPREDYCDLGLDSSDGLIHSWITPAGPDSYNLGQKFLENAYTAYDLENHRIGFAHLN